LIPEAIPIAVLLTGLLVAIAMITHHYLTARAERLREVCGSSSGSGSSAVVPWTVHENQGVNEMGV
jgi:hypothetical protein